MNTTLNKKWSNPLALATVCLLVAIIVPALVINHTGDISYDMKVLTRVPMFLSAAALTMVAGASLGEFSLRLRGIV